MELNDKNSAAALAIGAIVIIGGALSISGGSDLLTGQFTAPECHDLKEIKVSDESMQPIIKDGEKVTLNYEFNNCEDITMDDIVAYDYSGSEGVALGYIKAEPGDSVEFVDECKLIRNGDEIIKNSEGEPYCFSGSKKEMLKLYTGDEIGGYLMFSNEVSGGTDSSRFGPVSKSNIIGIE